VPAFTVGVGRTVILTFEEAAEQTPEPVVVRVSTAVPVNTGVGDHVAFNVFASGVKVPPAGVDHVPPVAEPPIEPAKVAEPLWQIVCAVPAFDIDPGLTVMLTVAETDGQGVIPVVVSVNTAIPE